MWEIIDNNGTIYSGDQEDMTEMFDIMVNTNDYPKCDTKDVLTDWSGDLKLIEVHNISR